MKNKNPKAEKENLRVFFRTKSIRDAFFSELKKKFGAWANTTNHFSLYKSRMEKFRTGNYSLPYFQFMSFLECLDIKNKAYFLNNVYYKEKNWGQIKAGNITYKKHKSIFDIGRKQATHKNSTKYKFDLNTPLTNELAEFIGAFIGDGFTNHYGRMHMVQFAGDSRYDSQYLENRLGSILRKLCPNVYISYRNIKNQNTIRMTIYAKELHILLTKRFGFPCGKKTYTVKIPDEILNSDKTKINSCIRGIFDTDGCVFFDKRESYSKPYLRICLNLANVDLIKQINNLLLEQDIVSTVGSNSKRLQINGFNNCKLFIEKIGFSNDRHLSKIKNLD
jgi:hypothetical protein